MKKEKNDLEKTDLIDEVNGVTEDETDITRKIDLDDLYDGAVNNTVVIDPVTKDEVLMSSKKSNNTILGIILAILILLGLYYVYNKSDLFSNDKTVVPVKTTTTRYNNSKSGILTCKYQSKSDNENEDASYKFNYVDDKIVKSRFDYTVVVISEEKSVIEQDIEKQYEDLYTKNSSIKGFNAWFSKSSRGFSFHSITDYNKINFEQITTEDDKTVLFIKPSNEDTITKIKSEYDKKGFTCTLNEE